MPTTAAALRPDRLRRSVLRPELLAYLFDLDGVLTPTALLHRAAWKDAFEPLLRERGLDPFSAADYEAHVDGRPRLEGIRAFLGSRGVELREAELAAVGERKNALLLERLRRGGIEPYPGSLRFVRAARAARVRLAVVSSSANCDEVLRAAGIARLFDLRIDGAEARERGLRGKPEPDTFLAAALDLGVEPERAVVLEDAVAGVAAGRAGGFGLVVGVDRNGHAAALRDGGADVVVADLADLLEPA